MNFNDFNELVKTRQSCRNFNDKPLEKETVEKIIKTAVLSPSACNSQPWKIYCVTGNKLPSVVDALTDNGVNGFLTGAKAFIVLTETSGVLKERISKRFDGNHFTKYDIGELTAYITLTAKSLGVDSCIIGWINGEKLKKAVGYPDDECANIVIALGYSDIPVREKSRKPLDEIFKFV